MSEFEKRNPITKKTSYSLWQAYRQGWLEALKWVVEGNDGDYCEDNISHVYKEIEELDK